MNSSPEDYTILCFSLHRHIYEDNKDEECITMENIESVIYCAEKYDLELLRKKCMYYMQSELKVGNIFTMLEIANKWNLSETKEICLKYIINDADCLKSDKFTDISREDVNVIFDSDKLRTLDEEHIYDSAMRWGEAECLRQNLCPCDEHIRQVLGPVLYSIRFPLLKKGSFSKNIVDKNLLSMSEKVSIYKYIDTKVENDCMKFSCKPRCCLSVCNRYSVNIPDEGQPPSSGIPKNDIIAFKLSKQGHLKAILVFEAEVYDEYSILIRKGTDTICCITETIIENVKNEERIRTIVLPESVLIPAEVVHTIAIMTQGYLHSYGSGPRSVVSYGEQQLDEVTFSEDLIPDELKHDDVDLSLPEQILSGFLVFSD